MSSSLSERCCHVKFFGGINASDPAHRSFAVRSGEINENTGKNPSMGPSVSFHSNTEAKKITISAHRSFTVLSGEMDGIQRKPREKVWPKIPLDFSYTPALKGTVA